MAITANCKNKAYSSGEMAQLLRILPICSENLGVQIQTPTMGGS